MNVKSVEKEKGSAKVVVEIDKAEFNDALGKAYTYVLNLGEDTPFSARYS